MTPIDRRQPPPRTWWDGYGYVFDEDPDDTDPDKFYGEVRTNGDTGGVRGLPEEAIELVPAGEVNQLRAALKRIVVAYFDEDDSTDVKIKDRDDKIDAACASARALLGDRP